MTGNKYILLHREGASGDNGACQMMWDVVEGEAQTEMEFLEGVNDDILEDKEWTVYEVVRGTNKDEYIHSGQIDELVDDFS